MIGICIENTDRPWKTKGNNFGVPPSQKAEEEEDDFYDLRACNDNRCCFLKEPYAD